MERSLLIVAITGAARLPRLAEPSRSIRSRSHHWLMKEASMKKTLLLGISGLCLVGCGGDEPGGVDAGPVPGCSLNAEVESTPGFPFEPNTFRNNVWPMLEQSCGNGTACHGEGNPTTFTVFPNNGDDCNFARSFNAVYDASDFKNNTANSPCCWCRASWASSSA